MTKRFDFPAGFFWGAATSAYQIEGAPLADGAGESIWHRFTRLPGAILNGDTGDVACDHYHRYPEDLELMRQMGLNAYRFSIAWGRLLPQGIGSVNDQGVAFYDRLIDGMLEAGLVPFATLYHWDLPAALEDRGGWLSEDSASWFGEFADVALSRFGDRVPFWATLNEPAIVMEKGYVLGTYAPGLRDPALGPIVARNLLRAHGTGVAAARADGRGNIGIVVNIQPTHPASEREEDRAAARRADAFRNRQFLDPIVLGTSPVELAEMFGDSWQPLSDADLALVHRPIDYVGINYYTRNIIRDETSGGPTRSIIVRQPVDRCTLMGWEVYPDGLNETLRWFTDRYGRTPLYVTENGAAYPDPTAGSGGYVDDPERVAFLRDHLVACHKALTAGVDLRGYFVWSLLDNFEWSSGLSKPFGIVHVDHDSQVRTIKASGQFYANTAQSGAVESV